MILLSAAMRGFMVTLALLVFFPHLSSAKECNHCPFQCDDSERCIELHHVCDGVSDCLSGSDESISQCGCPGKEFRCKDNGTCLDYAKICDRVADCPNTPGGHDNDTSDEENCEYHKCLPDHWQCMNMYCIPNYKYCDFVDDCGDNSDEKDCNREECLEVFFKCNNGECIYDSYFCDGKPDCIDGSDELGCATQTTHFLCPEQFYIKLEFVCDGEPDCLNHRDELDCNCSTTDYRCENSRCLRPSQICDGVCDCLNTCSDENGCHRDAHICNSFGDHLCKTFGTSHPQRCVRNAYLCDGNFDCLYGEDERICNAQCEWPMFMCIDGKCIPGEKVCDKVGDCSFNEDENECFFGDCKYGQYRCLSGQCVDERWVCDGTYNCYDRSDERDCDNYQCPENYFRCNLTGQCLLPNRICDHRRDCPDGSDEKECNYRKCREDEFQCSSGECIPEHMLCVLGPSGCKDGSHLWGDCRNKTCGHGMFKCPKSHCIDDSLVCNGEHDCIKTGYDENECSASCPYLSDQCECYNNVMNCSSRALQDVPYLGNDRYIRILDLSSNAIDSIKNNSFASLRDLLVLNLYGNKINSIEPDSFVTLKYLKALDLSGQRLKGILKKGTFTGLVNLIRLDLSNNSITGIEDGAFQGLFKLKYLDISRNNIAYAGKKIFNGLNSLKRVETDEYRFCCVERRSNFTCLPGPDLFSNCEDLLANYVLRVSIWIVGLAALIGNVMVIIWRQLDKRSSKINSFMITNLAFADFFMGLYLMIIASVDAYHRGLYIESDKSWRESALCTFAGFLTFFSSELSVFILTMITLFRLFCITFPFKRSRFGMRKVRICMFCIWSISIALSTIPLIDIDYFRMFYGRSGVCLALPLTVETYSNGWEYSFSVSIVLNLISFLVIFISYIWMFIVAKSTRTAARTSEMKCDNVMARRMTTIVVTDFLSWMPIIVIAMLSCGGVVLPSQVYAWTAVFVLPLNSALNPVLYTLSTSHFMRTLAERFQEMKVQTGDTRSTSAEEDREYIRVRRHISSESRTPTPMRMRSLSEPPPLRSRNDFSQKGKRCRLAQAYKQIKQPTTD